MPAKLETCWTLIQGAAGGRQEDRAVFAERYMPSVRAYLTARWQGSGLATEVEDVTHEVFLACLREGGVLEGAERDHPSGFRALLFSVTRNLALKTERDRGRRAARTNGNAAEVERTPADEPTLSRAFDREYARAIMVQARAEMARRAAADSDQHRRVELLRLRFEDDLPIREIAGRWGVEADRLHQEYAKAAREFRAALAEVVSATERCSPERLERECGRLLQLLRA